MDNKEIFRPSQVYGGCINVYHNTWLYPENTINIVESIANDPERDLVNWVDAPFVGSAGRQCKTINLTWLRYNSPNPILHHVWEQFHVLLHNYASAYYQDYGINENCYSNEPFNLIKYEKGDHYPNHYDGNTSLGRHLSAILYINDNFKGGELYFKNFDVTIKPKAGMLLLFPSNYAYQHEALPIIEGTKYAIVTWLHDRPNVDKKAWSDD